MLLLRGEPKVAVYSLLECAASGPPKVELGSIRYIEGFWLSKNNETFSGELPLLVTFRVIVVLDWPFTQLIELIDRVFWCT